jgi:hypothetical protein
VGQICSVDLLGVPTAGTFEWVESALLSGVYVMGCNTNPPA